MGKIAGKRCADSGLEGEVAREKSTYSSAVRIGQVHLEVADLERAIGFYRDVLGFELMQRFGTQGAFLSAVEVIQP